jgi:hypothetical protein
MLFCNLDRAFLTETALSLAFLDTFPVSQGHTLVIPKRHIETIWEMTTEEYEDAFDLIRKVKGNGFSPQVRQPPMMLALAGTSAPRPRWGDEAKPPGLLQSLAALLFRSSLSHTWFSLGGGDGKAAAARSKSFRHAPENQILRNSPSTLRLLRSISAEPLGLRRRLESPPESFFVATAVAADSSSTDHGDGKRRRVIACLMKTVS